MKAVISIIILGLALIVSIAVMIHGWGLEPHNWLWIIGGSLASVSLHAIGFVVGSHD